MKLLKLKVNNYKNLKNIDIDFERSAGCSLIVGLNGSGKSNLLEVISAIFSSLYLGQEKLVEDFQFELEYQRSKPADLSLPVTSSEIVIYLDNLSDGKIVAKCKQGEELVELSRENIDKCLPEHVIAVYSGEETRLWDNYYFEIYDNYNKQYINNTESYRRQRMIYFNHYYWEIIASILHIKESQDAADYLSGLSISGIRNIEMNFDNDKMKRNRNEMLKRILEIINPEQLKHVEIDTNKFKELVDICGYEEDLLYNMAVLILHKDFRIITDFKITTDSGVGIKDISEGEKKLLLIYGAINVTSGENLYLFDEPDAHLHESRKEEIYNLIRSDTKSQFVISTHSPTMSQLFNADKVIFFDRDDNECRIAYDSVSESINKLTNGQWNYIDHSLFISRARTLILTEGQGDISYIKKAIDIYSDEEKYRLLRDVDFIHCGGAQNVCHMVNELKEIMPSDKKIIVIFDRDDAGSDGLKSVIKEGGDKKDTKTYKKDQFYFFKLPVTEGYTKDTFVIEDYFSNESRKKIALSKLDKVVGFNDIPKDLKKIVKDDLAKEIESYTKNDMEGFKVLLDKIYDIINNIETVTSCD